MTDDERHIELNEDDINGVFEHLNQMAGAASIELTLSEASMLNCCIKSCIQEIDDYEKEHPDEERDYDGEREPLEKLSKRFEDLIETMTDTAAENEDGDFMKKLVAEKLEETGREFRIEPPAKPED